MSLAFPPCELPTDAVEIGRIQDAWGIKGWMKIHAHSRSSDALLTADQVFLLPPSPPYDRGFDVFSGCTTLPLSEVKTHADGIVALTPAVTDRNLAERLKGARLFMARSQFPNTDTDEYYWVDLIGLSVRNREGVELGVVRDLMATGPHSVLCIEYADGEKAAERMIPFVAAYVDHVDKVAGVITVDWQTDY